MFLLLASVLVGCQGSDAGFYDEQAKDEALSAARKDPFDGHSKVVSVGSVQERDECPQAPSPQAGPCLDVTVSAEVLDVGPDSAGPGQASRTPRTLPTIQGTRPRLSLSRGERLR